MGWEEQGTIFIACCLSGALVGIGADGYRAWQSSLRTDRLMRDALDCLLWCTLAILVCVLMLFMNGGDMRSYVFLALVVGYLAYRRVAGDRIVRLWLWCARVVQSVCRWVRRIVTALCFPIGWCLRTAGRVARWLAKQVIPKRKSPPDEKS